MKVFTVSLICVLTFFTLIELLPYAITIGFPNICYGCTDLGKLHQELNNKFGFSYFNFLAMLLLFLYLIYLTSVSKLSSVVKFIVIVACLLFIWLPVMPIINLFSLFLCACYRNPPFIKDYRGEFPASASIEGGADKIIAEYHKYMALNFADCVNKSNPGFRIENRTEEAAAADNCWRSIYIKRAGIFSDDMVAHFPETMRLLGDAQIHNAIFSILDPGVEIPPHVGYYKGYLRYHLGVEIPYDSASDDSNKAFIVCGDEKYVWRQGAGVVFDDLYLHYVKNPSNRRRVVLYLDVIRKSDNPIVAAVNKVGIKLIETSPMLKIFLTNQHKQNKIGDE
jgi:hypothetical protein